MSPLPSLKELRVDGNDISMVAKNAFIGANDLENLSLSDNPLSCDCSLKPFAEWISRSSISSQVNMRIANLKLIYANRIVSIFPHF